jgi:hypothetical protein
MTLERLRYYAYDEREPVLVNETPGLGCASANLLMPSAS